jgi:hypothetical protein
LGATDEPGRGRFRRALSIITPNEIPASTKTPAKIGISGEVLPPLSVDDAGWAGWPACELPVGDDPPEEPPAGLRCEAPPSLPELGVSPVEDDDGVP